MDYYETQELTAEHIKLFLREFDHIIGTEREVNDSPENEYRYYAVCGDLLPTEVAKCREIENWVTR
jgi:hypothetical protein